MSSTKKTQSFQDLFEELEHLVQTLEENEADIEQGIKDFERGLKLADQLKKRLKDSENKIIEIKKKFTAEEEMKD